jgi:exopolysaccharide/PEP-CTERM locus tyrosine autokinase
MSLIQEALERARASRDDESGPAHLPDISNPKDRVRGLADTISPLGAKPGRRHLKIDRQALRDGGVLAPINDDHLIARQIRDIKRPLIAHAFGKRATSVENGNLIMVTSALAGEGKTFISFNLARSMAEERDHTVLLVDADVAKPQTSRMFGLQDSIGLLDLLERAGEHLESAIVDTDTPGLSILPAGKPRPNSTELLASSRMEYLTQQLTSADRKRIVLFDSPPLLQTSESKVLAEFVGQIVLVVCAEQTPKGAVAEAVMSLGEEKAVNFILNKSTSNAIVTRYGYGHGGYGGEYRYPGSAPVGAASPYPRQNG